MINNATIATAFEGMVGVEPRAGLPTIPLSLQRSDSGLYYGQTGYGTIGMENLVSLESAFYCATSLENYTTQESKIQPYYADTEYRKGDLVRDSGKYYVAKKTGEFALTDAEAWEESSLFGEFLRKKMRAAAINTVQSVVYYGRNNSAPSPSLLNQSSLYHGFGYFRDTVEKFGRFVGVRFRAKIKNTVLRFNKISTHFTHPQTALKIYLYKDGQIDPIKIWEIDHIKGGNVEVHDLENFADVIDYGMDTGVYKLGYYEDDIEGKAISKDINVAYNSMCSTCDPQSYKLIVNNYKFLELRNFYVESEALDPERKQWDNDGEVYKAGFRNIVQTWGLNLWFSLECELTNTFVFNKMVFKDAYLAQIEYSILQEVAITNRANAHANSIRNILLQIGGNAKVYNQDKGPKVILIDAEENLQAAIKNAALAFNGVDDVCLPKVRSGIPKISFKNF